jgi:hypothetical protein
VDLVEAFKDIGLPEGAGEGRPADDPVLFARSRDAVAPNIEQLRRLFIVSRGRNAASTSGE